MARSAPPPSAADKASPNPATQPPKNAKPPKVKTGRGFAVVAFLLSLASFVIVAAIAVGGYFYYQNQSQRASELVSKEDQVTSVLSQSRGKFAAVEGDVNLLTQGIENNRLAIENLNQTFNYLFQDRYRWLLNEVEYGLGIISLQLINTGNVAAALKSLLYLRDRLAPFDYPELIALKKSLAADIEDLKAVNTVDLSETLVQLEVLNSKVESLPLLLDANLNQPLGTNESLQKALNSSWYEKVWNDLIVALKSGVQVRHLKSADPLLISPEQAFFVRENIKLLLMDARLALFQRQQDTFTQDLDAIKSSVQSYFDTKSQGVADFLEGVTALSKLNILSPNVDLIKHSLAIVKTLQSNQVTSGLHSPEKKPLPAVKKEDHSEAKAPAPATAPNPSGKPQSQE